MDSNLHSVNGTELHATAAVETDRKVEADAEPVADHPTVTTDLAPTSETTILEKLHYSTMASKLHSGTPETETESEIPATVVEVAPEKEAKPVADRPAVTPVDCVFRVIVPTLKVKSIIGQNGNVINKMCHETKANIRVLEGPIWHPDRVVLIPGKEDIEAPLSPATDAVIRVFKCVNGFPENESDGVASIPVCAIRLLLTSMQVTTLTPLKTIHENTGCSIRILPSDEVSTLSTNPDSRVVNLQGDGLKVLQTLEAVLRNLCMLWHDPTSTLEKNQVMICAEKSTIHTNTHPQIESQFFSSGLSCIRHDPVLSTKCYPGFVRTAGPPITQDTQRRAIPIRKAVDIIGVGGTNIADIGRTSGAILTVQEKKGLRNQIAVVMKGTSSQVKAARKLLRIKVKTVMERDRPAVLNKPIFHPQYRITAATKTPVEPQKEPTVCSSLLQVPQSRHRPMLPPPHVVASLSGMESINEPKRNRYHWNDDIVETFLDACIHEIAINGQEGCSLKAMSWKKVGEMLKATLNFSADTKQMKNYFDGLKSKYRAWVSLKHKTGNKYDPSTNTFNLTDKEWETEMKENKCIEELRKTPLRFPDLCAQLFDSGIRSWEPSFAEHIPETKIQKETMSSASPSSYNPPTKNKQFSSSVLSCFGLDPGLSTKCPPVLDRTAGPFITQAKAKTVRDGALADRTAPSSSSSKSFSVPSPTFGFGLFGSSSSSSGTSLLGSTSTFGTSTIFGASSTSAVTSAFSSGLYGSSSPTPSSTTPTSKTFGTSTMFGASSTSAVTLPFSSGLYGSSSLTPSFTTPTTTNTASKPFGTSTIFGASLTSAVTSPFSSGLCGSSSQTPCFTTPTITNTASKTFGTGTIFGASSTSAVTSPFSSGLYESSSPTPSFTTATTTNTASKPFGTSTTYGASSTSAVTMPFSSGLSGATTGYVPSFASPTTTTTGTSSSFLGFQTSPKTVAATNPSLQPQSTPASSLFGAQNIKESIRNKVYWNVDIVKTFLDACIHEITINGWGGGNITLKAMSWKKVGEMLKDRRNFYVDIEQMENYFDGLKSKYVAWYSLRNKCIETLRNPPLPFPDLCAQLFYGALAGGSFQTGSDQALTGPAHHRKKRNREVSGGPSGEASLEPQVPPVLPTVPTLPATQTLVELQKEAMVEVPPELPQVQPATVIQTKRSRPVFEEEIVGVLKMIAGKMNKPEPPPKPTFEDCEKKLNELGWPKDDPLHEVAFAIFCDTNDKYRECWMKLHPERCANWVRMIGRSKNFL